MLKSITSPSFRSMVGSIKYFRATNHPRNVVVRASRCMGSSNDPPKMNDANPSMVTNESAASIDVPEFDLEASDDENDAIWDREFVDMKVSDFKSLYEHDETNSIRSQIETILNEYEFQKYNSMGRVPSVINSFDMRRILEEGPTPNIRVKLFSYLFKREMAKRATARARQRDKFATQDKLARKHEKLVEKYGAKHRTGLLSDNGQILYGLWHNSLFCRIPEKRVKGANTEFKLIEAALFSNKVVLDFDFDNYMTVQTSRSCMEQVQESYGLNRFQYREPYDLWFCNFDEKSRGGSYLADNCLRNLFSGTMVTVKKDCFTNYFDKSNLIYLSPDARMPLTTIRPDDVLVIGVYNDKGSVKPLTFRKAERLGIQARCLPIDSYLAWQGGTKSLCINHVLSILLEVRKNGGDWRDALLKCVPTRKVKSIEVVMQLEEQRRSKQKRKFNLREDFD